MPCALHSRMAGCPGGSQAGCEPACVQPYTALLHNGTAHVCPSVFFVQTGCTPARGCQLLAGTEAAERQQGLHVVNACGSEPFKIVADTAA